MPTSWPPPQSPVVQPSAGKPAWRPSGATPTQLIPAPQTIATPQPCSVPARRTASVSLPTETLLRQAARRGRLLHLLDLGGEVDAREQQLADVGDRAVAVRDPGVGERLVEQVVDHLQRAVEAEVVRRAEPAADEREHLAVGAHEREVGLRVAAVDREDERCAHARSWAKNCGRCSRSAASSCSVSSSTGGTCPTSGCASSAL